MRINKFLAHATGLSRREADNAVIAGRVFIDNHRADMGAQVEPRNVVTFDGKTVGKKTDYTYIMLNKPVGYLCSRRSQGGVPTIYSLLPEQFRPLKAVGRLDKDSSGLILLTDDGDFAFHMTHPSFYKVKIYEVTLDHALEPLHQQMISDYGVTLEDGGSKFLVVKLDLSSQSLDLRENHRDTPSNIQDLPSKNLCLYSVTMHEGRNRQIRRTFAALGYDVTKLHRTTFGPYTLGDIRPGEFSTTIMR